MALIGLFVASVAILGLVKLFMNPQPGAAAMELFKAVLQLGVISVAAAALALLSFNYQFERQQEERKFELVRRCLEYREELLRTILGRATSSYAAVKKARRLLRARALRQDSNDKTILTKVYDEQMDSLNDAQLDFENLQRDVENSRPAFSQPEEIVENLRCVDRYLGILIKEYERKRPSFTGDNSTRRVARFLLLPDFLKKSKTSLFMRYVVDPFHDVQRLLRADLLNPQLVDLTPLVNRTESVSSQGTSGGRNVTQWVKQILKLNK